MHAAMRMESPFLPCKVADLEGVGAATWRRESPTWRMEEIKSVMKCCSCTLSHDGGRWGADSRGPKSRFNFYFGFGLVEGGRTLK
jgi:hypothetical protein